MRWLPSNFMCVIKSYHSSSSFANACMGREKLDVFLASSRRRRWMFDDAHLPWNLESILAAPRSFVRSPERIIYAFMHVFHYFFGLVAVESVLWNPKPWTHSRHPWSHRISVAWYCSKGACTRRRVWNMGTCQLWRYWRRKEWSLASKWTEALWRSMA
jgi:hypothetical protein